MIWKWRKNDVDGKKIRIPMINKKMAMIYNNDIYMTLKKIFFLLKNLLKNKQEENAIFCKRMKIKKGWVWRN